MDVPDINKERKRQAAFSVRFRVSGLGTAPKERKRQASNCCSWAACQPGAPPCNRGISALNHNDPNVLRGELTTSGGGTQGGASAAAQPAAGAQDAGKMPFAAARNAQRRLKKAVKDGAASFAADTLLPGSGCLHQHHGMPTVIVSDRDSRFTSNFPQSLMKPLGTQPQSCPDVCPSVHGDHQRTPSAFVRCFVRPPQVDRP